MAKLSKIRLRPGETIGELAAEHDKNFLHNCFIDFPFAETLKDTSSHRCILLGRTGSGKSAFLLNIESRWSNVSRIKPKEASFQFLANSTIIRVLTEVGVDLHVFYEYLWKHILCIHIIRECLGVRTEEQTLTMLRRVQAFVTRDQRKKAVINYLERHRDNFWTDADEVSRELTNGIERELSASMGLTAAAFSGEIEKAELWKEEDRRTIKCRAQTVVNNLQVRELNETINALSDLLADKCAAFYVVIDDLDEKWVGETSQYPMIRALIESIKTFGRIPNLKIIVGLREDVYEAMIRATTDRHFQAEKFEGMIFRIRWSAEDLLRLVEIRINHLFKSRYTKRSVRIEEVLPSEVWGQDIRSFLVEHTLKRPRDIIALVNKILSSNEKGVEVPVAGRVVTSIEPSYARDRLKALEAEWRSCHPLCLSYIAAIPREKQKLVLADFDEDRLSELVLDIVALGRLPADSIERLASQAYERDASESYAKLASALVCCLFKMGIVGVKLAPERPFSYCFDEQSSLGDVELTSTTRIVVHPMFASALGRGCSEKAAA